MSGRRDCSRCTESAAWGCLLLPFRIMFWPFINLYSHYPVCSLLETGAGRAIREESQVPAL
jgi:hypothetical protein